jgi:hypothetical protein
VPHMAEVYFGNDAYVVCATGQTTEGHRISQPPYRKLPTGCTDVELGAVVGQALTDEISTIDHPVDAAAWRSFTRQHNRELGVTSDRVAVATFRICVCTAQAGGAVNILPARPARQRTGWGFIPDRAVDVPGDPLPEPGLLGEAVMHVLRDLCEDEPRPRRKAAASRRKN